MSEKMKEEKNGQAIVAASNLPSDVKKAGVLRKLKTMKKKYFVLRTESSSGPARLEYYDSMKKFQSGIAPKRSICIKKCFNINRKVDAKQKLAIALYTKDDCFSVVAETEQMLEEWLKALLELQFDGTCVNGTTTLRPKFEHVWQVSIGEKSLACTRNMKGLHRLCLTSTSLTLIKVDQSDNPEKFEFPLMSIRRCGHSNNYFLIELGRSSITGAGELWLETEDVVIAQNMHEVTLTAMKSCRELEDMGSHRPRSSSNSETSRPIATRRPVAIVSAQPNPYPSIRDRCDSMPSRPRTISEGQEINNRSYYASPNHPLESLRSHSGYPRTVSYSPPGMPNPLSPTSTACSTDSAGSSLSIDEYDGGQNDFAHGRYSHSMPSDNPILIEPAIKEEQLDDYLPMSIKPPNEESSGYMHMAATNSYSSSAPSGPSLYLNLNSSSASFVSQSSDYMDMTSPLSPPGDYLPMSPIGNKIVADDIQNMSSNAATGENPEGYLYMAPTTAASASTKAANEGYLDMSALFSSLPKSTTVLPTSTDRFNFHGSNNASDTSINSSSDTSKNEVYRLDKVKSLLTQTDDASEDYIRPVRAYSMGSRPQPKKTHLSIHNEGSRIRAYSVGSQAVSARNKAINSAEYELGNFKRIDCRSGTKSSSAPLLHNRPPKLRSSTSRGDVGNDLMEIDFNKTRHFTSGSSLRDSEFTIEPVGRSRSGSYSSSVTSSLPENVDKRNKPIYERDKGGFHSATQNAMSSTELLSDYMPMSGSWSKSKTSGLTTHIKPVEHVHPSGDYVSLNPAIRYSMLSGTNVAKTITSNVGTYKVMAVPTTSQLQNIGIRILQNQQINSSCNRLNDQSDKKDSSRETLTSNVESAVSETKSPCHSKTSDYVCMNCQNPVIDTQAADYIDTSNSTDTTQDSNCTIMRSENSTRTTQQNISPEENISSNTNSGVSSQLGDNTNTYINANNSYLSSTEQLSKVVNSVSTENTCKDLRLNYASLDLKPSVPDEDGTLIMPVHRTRLSANLETKEALLTYAQIDFSSSPMPDTVRESLSHL